MRIAKAFCAVGLLAVVTATAIGCGGEKTVVRKETTTRVEAVPAAPVVRERTTTIETQ